MIDNTTFNVTQYYEPGVLTYPFEFGAMSPDDVKAYDLDPTKTPDDPAYATPIPDISVSPAPGGIANGGNVTLPGELAAGNLVYIVRETPKTQESAFDTQQRIQPKAIEKALDKLTMQTQEQDLSGLENQIKAVSGRMSLLSDELASAESEIADLLDQVRQQQTEIQDLDQIKADQAATTAALGTKADKAYVDTQLANKAAKVHTHAPSEVTGLDSSLQAIGTALNGKASTAVATQSANGLLSAADKTKLDGIDPSGSGMPSGGNVGDIAAKQSGGVNGWDSPNTVMARMNVATASVKGLMSSADKSKLDSLSGGSGGEGTSDHNLLLNRDMADQHPIAAVEGLRDELDGIESDVAAKANASDMSTALNGKAPVTHTHEMSQVNGLANALAAKASETWVDDNFASLDELEAGLSDKANVSHSHTVDQVSGLQTALAGKAPLASPALTGTPTINGVALANMALVADAPADGKTYGRKSNAWVEAGGGGGAVAGDIRLWPFRKDELPAGWYYPSGDYVAQSSAQGQVLASFSANFKSDWGITVSGSNIRLCDPNKFFNGTMGRFPRPVNGSNRLPGSIENNATLNIAGSLAIFSNVGGVAAAGAGGSSIVSGAFQKGSTSYTYAPGYSTTSSGANLLFDAASSIGSANIATEIRPHNVGMTPAIYLGV